MKRNQNPVSKLDLHFIQNRWRFIRETPSRKYFLSFPLLLKNPLFENQKMCTRNHPEIFRKPVARVRIPGACVKSCFFARARGPEGAAGLLLLISLTKHGFPQHKRFYGNSCFCFHHTPPRTFAMRFEEDSGWLEVWHDNVEAKKTLRETYREL